MKKDIGHTETVTDVLFHSLLDCFRSTRPTRPGSTRRGLEGFRIHHGWCRRFLRCFRCCPLFRQGPAIYHDQGVPGGHQRVLEGALSPIAAASAINIPLHSRSENDTRVDRIENTATNTHSTGTEHRANHWSLCRGIPGSRPRPVRPSCSAEEVNASPDITAYADVKYCT